MNVGAGPYSLSMDSTTLIVSPRASDRLDGALEWLASRPPTAEVLVVGETLAGPHDLILRGTRRVGATLGWRRMTLSILASELAAGPLGAAGLAPGTALARDAIVERAMLRLPRGDLGRFGPVADTPGFSRAVGESLDELRMAGVGPAELAAHDPDLSSLSRAVEDEWGRASLADRARVLEVATGAVRDPAFRHSLLDHPTLMLDVRVWTRAEARFVEALLQRAPESLATAPAGDSPTLASYAGSGFVRLHTADAGRHDPARALARLQTYLFESPPEAGAPDGSLTVFSAPGESRECVEIVRRLLALAAAGGGFDRAAILLRQPEDYRPYLEEALGRGRIPAYFARAVPRPDPAGRAFLALLRCLEEDYAALRFAEYLSIGEVPDAVRAGTVRDPRRWERLLVDASVVGGRDRWARRLASLRDEIALKRDGLEDLEDLEHLREYALPLLEDLGALPESATWAVWLEALRGLAASSICHPDSVLETLADLAPMGPIGPVSLIDVLRTLGPRLVESTEASEGNRYGKVYVGPIDSARGLSFDVVFVPGMAERVFPPKIAEDPILLDEVREALNDSGGPRLPTNDDRVAAERLALKIAVGAAREQVILSYPRIEAVKSRPRVPSFYMLEAVRAAEGTLPKFEELAKRAEQVSEARIGWPAPKSASRAIDEAEYDLAVLDDLGLRGDAAVRAAGHLLHSNPHLARALRFRAYRWEVRRWTWADGLVSLSEGAAEALAAHSPEVRAFSATALQHFAACPYRFYLYTIQRLSPREEPSGIEALDPLQRGSLVHQVQFELLTRLQRESERAARGGGEPLLPVRPGNRDRALAALDEVLDKVAGDFEDRLVPAISRVWTDGIESIRQDLREWLHRASLDPTPFEPWRFELSFGLPPDPDRDARSVPDPIDLGVGIKLRGAIDLVERTPAGVLRVTDHKTGRYRASRGAIIQGGELLQPVLYGLAAQRMFPDADVQSGRLYYCTADGGYREHEVPLNADAVEAARVLAGVLGGAFEAGAFHALPRSGACTWCDYRTVCGPDEERRIRRKPDPIELNRLRDLQ